ncbi:MAG TPA: polysaccharide biosynthesis/export family protein [Pyrinomonadaceae bacterium]|nr:polysaccharide biosynthesis/export family protein [Pyrinomonadaceae bacterium]
MTIYTRMALALVMLVALAAGIAAQPQTPAPSDPQKARPRTTSGQEKKDPKTGEHTDDTSPTTADIPADMQANRQGQMSEEAAITGYYNNFFSTYRLGPEDIISVEVFNQDRYSRKGIIIPPSGRISLSLIPGGVFVNGKTVDEVAEVITKKYDEFIIDPQVTVSLDKASSYRYSVIGDVGQPGVRLMNHRMTVTEALAEAGGVLSTGDRSKVYVLRRQPTGLVSPIVVNVSAIYKGKAPDTTYLVPGDQIIVPGNKMKKVREWLGFTSVLGFARIFGVPVP